MRASTWPCFTCCPAFTFTALSVPPVWNDAETSSADCTAPLADTLVSTTPRCTVDVRAAAVVVPEDEPSVR